MAVGSAAYFSAVFRGILFTRRPLGGLRAFAVRVGSALLAPLRVHRAVASLWLGVGKAVTMLSGLGGGGGRQEAVQASPLRFLGAAANFQAIV